MRPDDRLLTTGRGASLLAKRVEKVCRAQETSMLK
jgi:hypothetical protein